MYELISFSDCDIDDPFFDSLKEDYPEFSNWFCHKSESGAEAFVSRTSDGLIEAFVYVKKDDIEVLCDLPAVSRVKVGTFKIASTSEGTRLGEGGIGLSLWTWQRSSSEQIYVTIFPKHQDLIGMVERYGFRSIGRNDRGEIVYLKDKISRNPVDSDISGLKLFPYIDSRFSRGMMVPIRALYHDNMFQYSKLRNTEQKTDPMPVANGITKMFIATPWEHIDYRQGDVALIYRISDQDKQYKSAITTYCTVISVEWFKTDGRLLGGKTWDDFVKVVGNKTVYDMGMLKESFSKGNVCIIKLLYNGYFGEDHNVNYKWLKDNDLFWDHPYKMVFSPAQVRRVLQRGGIDEGFAFIHQSRTRGTHLRWDQKVRV